MQSREELLYQITMTGFVMDDLRLFLDTHPCESRAIALFNENAEKYEALCKEYTNNYGGFNSYSVNNDSAAWLWNNCPMPWEGEM